MKFAITGSAGQISKPLATRLLQQGHDVAIIGRNKNKLKELEQSGAQIFIGSLEDGEFLKKAFEGATAVYTMSPPNFETNDMKAFSEKVVHNYVDAITDNGIGYVVNLSSIGAHLTQGAGPVSTMHHTEQILNSLKQVNIKHLRPAYFYSNLLGNINMIKTAGIIGNNFSNRAKQFPVSDAADIAAVAAEELTGLEFTGHSIRYLASDETDTDEIAAAIGNAIGKPGLRWLKLDDDQVFKGLLQAGIPEPTAAELVELGNAIDSGNMFDHYRQHRPEQFGSVKLKDFVNVFSSIYNAN